MKNNACCPICGLGQVSIQTVMTDVEHAGRHGQVPTAFKLCNHCGSEFADADIARVNKRAMLAFRKRADGLLAGSEIRALRERVGLSQKQAAILFGGGPVAFSKYENDDVSQSEAMDKLLRLAFGDAAILRRLIEQSDAQPEFAHWHHDDSSVHEFSAGYRVSGGELQQRD